MMLSIKANREGPRKSQKEKTIRDRNPEVNLAYVTVSIVTIIMPRSSALHMGKNAKYVVEKSLCKEVLLKESINYPHW